MSQVRAAPRPTTLGHYSLIEHIGTGGQGEVWRAHDESRGVDVALKVLAPAAARNPAAWEALEREHAITSRLQHPGILQVLPPERLDDAVVLPMELAAGGDLRRLRGSGYLEIVPVLLEAAETLEYAHARGVVHRDLKPGNVLLDGRGRVKVADFGIAGIVPTAGTGAAGARGGGHSPFSASPEQLRGEPPSAADDIYGLGALAYELLSGHPPYYPNFDLRRVLTQPVPELVPTRQIPPELSALVMRMLAKSAAERPASMQQVMDELDATLNATLSFAPEGAEEGDADGPPPDEIPPAPRESAAQTLAPKPAVPLAPAPTAPAAAPPHAMAPARAMQPAPSRLLEPTPSERRAQPPAPIVVDADSGREHRVAAAASLQPQPLKPVKPLPATAAAPRETARSLAPPPREVHEAPSPAAPPQQQQRAEPPVQAIPAAHASGAAAAPPAASATAPAVAPTAPAAPIAPAARAAPVAAAPSVLVSPAAQVVSPADQFAMEIGQPQLRAIPPPGRRYAPARAGGGHGHHWPYLVSGLLCGAVLICGATAAALFWLPRKDLASVQSLLARVTAVASPGAAAPTAAAVKPAAKPAVAAIPAVPRQANPAALAQLDSETAAFDKQAAALAARGAASWDGAEFSAAQMQAAQSSGAAAAGGVPIALQHLQRAQQILAGVARKAPRALAAELRLGDAALAAGQQVPAIQAFALAIRIDPNSREAIQGARRARLLSGVLPLLADGRRAQAAQNYSRAAQDFSQALALDPGNAAAKQGLARANAAFGDDSYARAVGAGFAALGAGRLTQARADFQQALTFRPGGTEAGEGLQRVSAAMQAGKLAALRQQAASLEAQEHWRQAAAVYEAALRADPSLAFARRGEDRAEARATLAASLQQIIDHPSELALQSVRDEAVQLLQEAREQTPSGPVLQSQARRVARLLPALDRPVLLHLMSDDATQVSIPTIGVFGAFARREIRLKPGTYTVIGTRDGYRAVEQEFTVEPGQQSVTITVSCSERS